MKSFSFKRNFKQLGFRTPDWQRAKYLFKIPLKHLFYLKKRLIDQCPIWKQSRQKFK